MTIWYIESGGGWFLFRGTKERSRREADIEYGRGNWKRRVATIEEIGWYRSAHGEISE